MLKRVIVALDYTEENEANSLLAHWQGGEEKPFIKVGYALFFKVGLNWIAQRKEEGFPIFLDLKLHDIPNTVKGAIQSLSSVGVDFLTLHAAGGRKMIAAAREAVDHYSSSYKTKLIAVTQLTSTDQSMLNNELRIDGNIYDAAIHYAKFAVESGADGVVCSGWEVAAIKNENHSGCIAITPGIRPRGSKQGDQHRVMTPLEAFKQGSDYIVVGRPITEAASPVDAYHQIVKEVEYALEESK